MSSEEKINIPQGAYTYVIGKDSKNIILYSQYGIKVLLPNRKTIILQCEDPIKLRKVKMDVLSNIGNVYSVFEHPGIITNLLVYDKQLPFQLKKYKDDIQDKYRIIYSNQAVPQVVKSVINTNNWEIYTRDKLIEALDRNNGIQYEVTIGRNTFYSSNKTKEIKDVDNRMYYIGNFRTMSVGYGKDIKVKWDPILSEGQVKYVMDKLDQSKIINRYVKSGTIIVDSVNGTRNHCTVVLVDNVPVASTFKSKVEKPIKETVIVSRLDTFPDIRYKFTVNSTKTSTITSINDVLFNDDMTIEHKDGLRYYISYSYINSVIKYNINGINIKFVHNTFDKGNVIKFSSNTLKSIEILDYINNIFGLQ